MDKFFNHEVADWITKSMSRMDPDEAEMFGLFLVDEVYWADRENNARLINRHVEDIHKSILRDLDDPVAKRLVETVSKAKGPIVDPDIAYDKKWGKPQPRDKGGRFVKIRMPGFDLEYQTNNKGERVGQPHAVYRHGIRTGTGRAHAAEFDLSSALDATQREGTAFQERWNRQTASSTERTYNRIATGGNLVRTLGAASGNGNLYAAGRVGEFVGEFGPEAEKVIGPAARKTAYRYRGTERTPSKQIDDLHDEILTRRLRGEGLSTKDITPELRMDTAETAAILYLGNKLPSQQLAELQQKSGKIPPSQGVMIGADGNVVAEAVGYNEDHYLPFNLKNLKGLKGGAYVRTRSTGGLTTEDIYTGLLGGARSVTVVSRSGVFTLDFDDELRGGRRYSDKAHQMVGRYAHILDAIKSEQVVREKLSPEERAEIRANVEEDFAGMHANPKEIEDEISAREKDFISGVRYTQAEVDEVNAMAEAIADEYTGLQGQKFDQIVSHTGGRMLKGNDYREMPKNRDARVRAIKSELMDALREKKSKRKWVLDGEGYAVAMDALQEQYPYFIQNVDYKPYRELNGQIRNPSNERDKGYVKPRYNRPEAALEGYYDESIEGKAKGKGKYSADTTKYQNYQARARQAEAAEDEGEEGAEAKAGAKARRPVSQAEAAAAGRAAKLYKQAVLEAAEHAATIVGDNENNRQSYKMIARFSDNKNTLDNFSDEDVAKLMDDVARLDKRMAEVKLTDANASARQKMKQAITLAEQSENALKSQTTFDASKFNPAIVDKFPVKFKDSPEHTLGALDGPGYALAYDKAAQRGYVEDEVGSNPTDKELQDVQEVHSKLYTALRDVIADPEDAKTEYKLIQAAQDAGLTGGTIAAMQKEILDGDTAMLTRRLNGARHKVTAIVELRSILRAAGGSLNRNQPELTNPNTIKGEVVTSAATTTPAKTTPLKAVPISEKAKKKEEIRSTAEEVRAAAEHMPSEGIKRGVLELANAIEMGSDHDVRSAWENLPGSQRELFKPLVKRELEDRGK